MDKNIKPVVTWLLTGCFLVSVMVVVGGITRLTQSGLSMVEWSLIMGSIPPANEAEWQSVFEKYMAFPEYQVVNYDFTLEQFKSIFWWEYIHRLIGRLLGIVFIVPFIIFLIQKRINKKLLTRLLVIFFLGAFQGFLGWYMVKSGLVNVPQVSHFRLASHLIVAFAVIGFTLWTVLEIAFPHENSKKNHKLRKPVYATFISLVLQIIYGAFVAGLKAGLYYSTWPKMGNAWIPSEIPDSITRDGFISLLSNISMVQFIHRYLAVIVLALGIWIWFASRSIKIDGRLKTGINFLGAAILVQFLLGVFTLIFKVPVILGVLHQLGALVLFMILIFLLYEVRNTKRHFINGGVM